MKKETIVYNELEGPVERVRLASRGIVVRNGQILLSYEQNNDRYLIPGGGMEMGETYLDCLKRELLEETGVLVSAKEEFLEIEEYFHYKVNRLHVQHYFVCEIVEETSSRQLTEAEVEAGSVPRWVPLDEALKIFTAYPEHETTEKPLYGLYKREFLALSEYLKLAKKA